MSDTVFIPLSKSSWTDVTTGSSNGIITNSTGHSLRYLEAATQPNDAVEDGHLLTPENNTPFYLTGSQKIWARGIIENGRVAVTSGNALTKDGTFTRDFLTEVRHGNVFGHELIHKFGSNPDVGVSFEDIWEGSGIYPWALAAETLSVVSTSALDNPSSTGAFSVIIKGLDTNFDFIEETIALAGATPVTTVNAYRRFTTAVIDDVGAYTGTNAGTITFNGTTSGNLQGVIPATEGRTSQVHFTVANNTTAYIQRIAISMDTGKSVGINLHNRPGADIVVSPFKGHSHSHHWDGLSSPIVDRFFAGHKFLAKTDIWFDGITLTGGAGSSIDVDYDILVVDN